jgi:hypothetical protein
VQTAALAFGGEGSPGNDNETEEYDGSSWSEQNTLNTARESICAAGTQTAAVGFGGYVNPGGASALTEEYDGTSWTASNNMGTARYSLAGSGIQTAALAFGGSPTTGATEQYDGTSWTTSTSMTTARRQLASANASPSTSSLAFGGFSTANVATTEEFTGEVTESVTITSS